MNRRVLWLLFAANIISGVAQGVSMLAIPLYFAQHNRAADFNFAYAFITLSTLVWGLLAGTIVDAFKRKQVFIWTNLIQATILLGISSYGYLTGAVPDFFILMVFTTTLLGYQIHYPNLYAFSQEITPPQQYAQLTSSLEITGQCTSIVGGGLAALLLSGWQTQPGSSWWQQPFGFTTAITPWTMQEIIALDGITYLIAALLISQIRNTGQVSTKPTRGSFSFTKQMQACLSYVRQQPLLMLFGSLSNVVFVAVSVELHTLMPSYLLQHLKAGPMLTGAAQAIFAVGALLAGIFIRKVFVSRSTRQAIVVLMASVSCCFVAVAISSSVFVFCAFCFAMGFANTGIRIFRLTYLLKRIPNYLMGRINSVFTLTNTTMRTLFSFLFSQAYFTTGAHITVPFLIIAIYVLAATALILAIGNRVLHGEVTASTKRIYAVE